jgi:hypothetical protein
LLQNCASNLSARVRSLLFLILAGHAELVQLQLAIYQSIHRKAHCLCGYRVPTNRQLRFPAVACTLNASMPGPWSNVLTWTEFRSFVHAVSSDMVFFAPLLMHPWVLFDRRQCLVSYMSCSAQDEEVYDHERVDEHEGYWVCVSAYLCILAGRMGTATCSHAGWGTVGGKRTPHKRAYRRHEVYQPRLYTRIVTLAAKTGLDATCPPDCRER